MAPGVAPWRPLLLALSAALGSACPCCPECMPVYCPCACATCGNVPTSPPYTTPSPTSGPWSTPAPTTPSWTTPVRTTPPPPGPLLRCDINCYGEGAVAVPLPGGDGRGVKAETLQVCRDYCLATDGCEAIVYGRGECWGKKDVRTSRCHGGDDFVTEILTAMPIGTCSLMGDPHILTFDNPNGIMGDLTQLRSGEYWLVKSTALSIQARFGFSKRFPSGSSTTGVAVGGPLMQGHKLTLVYAGPETGYRGFNVAWDGARILNSVFPSSWQSPDGVLKASLANMNPGDFHNQARHTIGGTQGDIPSYLFELVPGVRIYVVIGDETINLVVTTKRPDGNVDGYCGNFNCLSEDDTLVQVTARGLAAPVGADSLFAGAPPPPAWQGRSQGQEPDPQNCPPDLMRRAEEACAAAGRPAHGGCIFDVCAAGDVSVARDDVITAALQHEMTRHFELFGFVKLPQLIGGQVSAQAQWGIAGMAVVLLVGGVSLGYTSRGAQEAGRLGEWVSPGDASDEEALLGPAACEHEPLLDP